MKRGDLVCVRREEDMSNPGILYATGVLGVGLH